MSRFAYAFAGALAFAVVSTAFAGAGLLSGPAPSASSVAQNTMNAQAPVTASGPTLASAASPSPPARSLPQSMLGFFEGHSLTFAPTGWFLVGGLWIWRGRMRSRWEALGFDSEVFELFVRMRGGKTRVRLMNSLMMPKDRFQLAHELGMDWKAVDHHIMTLSKAGFVRGQVAYGRVRMYELTSVGKTLLHLLKDMGEGGEPGLAAPIPPKVPQGST